MRYIKLLSLSLLAVLLLACSEPPKFEKYVSRAGGFRVMVPERMSYSLEHEEYLDANVEVHVHKVSKNGIDYTVKYFDLPDEINDHHRKQGGDWSRIPGVDTLIINKGWITEKATSPRVTDANGSMQQTHGFTVVEGEKLLHIQHVWYQNRIYQLTVSRPIKPTYTQEVDVMKFNESFDLI